jgi:hypothetical protein
MNSIKLLTREEMKKVSAGYMDVPGCSVTVTCPSGRTISCHDPGGDNCYSESDGTIHGYVNCGVGAAQVGCWMQDSY